MRIYILRHGQTHWNKLLRWQGNQDTILDETGVKQIHRSAEELSLCGVSKIYTSPLKRAAMSAGILNRKIGVDIIYREGLREIHLGKWEGFTTQEIIEKYGRLFVEWENNPVAQVGLGVENMLDLQRRAYDEFCAIATQKIDKLAIVTHGTWTRCLLCKLLNIPLENRMNFSVDNAGISVIDCTKNGNGLSFTVITMNDISHLLCDIV